MIDTIKQQKAEKEISLRYVVMAIIFWILTLSWIVVIFGLSSDNASESSDLSKTVLNIINEVFNSSISDDSLLRVIAHSSEFAILTVFTYLALSSTNKISVKTSYSESPVKLLRSDNEMNIIFTLWFTIINAIFDEYHQLFVDGRDGSILDVLIDLIGIIVVLIIVRIIFTVYMKTKGESEVIYT